MAPANLKILGGSLTVSGSTVRAGVHSGANDADISGLKFVSVEWSTNETFGSLHAHLKTAYLTAKGDA